MKKIMALVALLGLGMMVGCEGQTAPKSGSGAPHSTVSKTTTATPANTTATTKENTEKKDK